MAEVHNFRSAFNGFNREDVVRYITYINNRHHDQVNQLNSEKRALAEELAALRAKEPAEDLTEVVAQLEAEREKALRLPDMTDEEAASTTVYGVSAVYQRHLAGMDQAQIAKASDKPFLFLWGERDFQVEREAFWAWRERLGDDEQFSYKAYPGLNHLLMPAGESDSIANAAAAYQEPKVMDQQVTADIAAWILSL